MIQPQSILQSTSAIQITRNDHELVVFASTVAGHLLVAENSNIIISAAPRRRTTNKSLTISVTKEA